MGRKYSVVNTEHKLQLLHEARPMKELFLSADHQILNSLCIYVTLITVFISPSRKNLSCVKFEVLVDDSIKLRSSVTPSRSTESKNVSDHSAASTLYPENGGTMFTINDGTLPQTYKT